MKKEQIQEVVANQVSRYIDLGFHSEVYPNLSEDDAQKQYRTDFVVSDRVEQPSAYAGRFDELLAAEPRVPLSRKMDLAARLKDLALDSAVSDWQSSRIVDLVGHIEKRAQDITPHPTDRPYLLFTHDGQIYQRTKILEVVGKFAQDEVGNTLSETIDLLLQYPSWFSERSIMNPAGSVDSYGLQVIDEKDLTKIFATRYIYSVSAVSGAPRISIMLPGPMPFYTPLSRGSECIPLGS